MAKPKELTEEQKSEVSLKLKRAKISMQKDYPFFSDILFFMELIESKSVPTMGVNIKGQVFYNPEFVLGLSTKELKGVLCHEAVHPAWLHITRGLNKKNHMVWNLAIDCHANFMVMKSGLQLPRDVACVPNLYRTDCEIRIGSWSYSVDNVDAKPSEVIYDELMKNIPPQQMKMLNDFSSGIDIHDYTFDGDPEALDRESEKWTQRTINAAERARQQGKLPAGMERIIGDLLTPKVNWRNLLYEFISTGIPSDRTWKRRDKRYACQDLYMPANKNEGIEVIAFIDTSGSIGDEEISQVKTELVGMARQFDAVKMALGFCDAKVQSVIDFDNVSEEDIMKAKPKGGGGTDMTQCIKWVEKNCPDATTLVILTDGYTPFPRKQDVKMGLRVLWLIVPGTLQEKDIPQNVYGEFVFMTGG